MSDIFDELGSAHQGESEPSPLTGVFAPELIEAMPSEMLLALMKAAKKTIDTALHPDKLLSGVDEAVAKKASGLSDSEETDDVTELRGRLLAAAELRDDYKSRLEKVSADPSTAKMQAILDRQSSARVSSRSPINRRTKQPAPVATPKFVPTITASTEERRARQEASLSNEALRKFGGAIVLLHADGDQAVLYDLWGGPEWKNSYGDGLAKITAKPLTEIKPSPEYLKMAKAEIIQSYQDNDEVDWLSAEQLRIYDDDGNLRLAPHLPEKLLKDTVTNRSLLKFLKTLVDYNAINYQMAVLGDDGLSYNWYPTAAGQAAGLVARNDAGQLLDWARLVYGQVPSILRLDTTSSDELSEGRTVIAYQTNAESGKTIFKSDGNMVEYKQLRMLGYCANLSKHSFADSVATPDNAVNAGAANQDSEIDDIVRAPLRILQPNLDVEMFAGDSKDFYPAHSLHYRQPMHKSPDFGLVFAIDDTHFIVGDDVELDTTQSEIENRQIFALRGPLAIGITSSIRSNSYDIRTLQDGSASQLAEELGQSLTQEAVRLVLRKLADKRSTKPN